VQLGRNNPPVKISLSPPLPLIGKRTGGKLLPNSLSRHPLGSIPIVQMYPTSRGALGAGEISELGSWGAGEISELGRSRSRGALGAGELSEQGRE